MLFGLCVKGRGGFGPPFFLEIFFIDRSKMFCSVFFKSFFIDVGVRSEISDSFSFKLKKKIF